MSTQRDMERIVEGILGHSQKTGRKMRGLFFMGHGTHHPSNAFYAALMFQLQLKDPRIFVGTVEGYPDVDLIKKLMLRKENQNSVFDTVHVRCRRPRQERHGRR